MIMQNLVFVIIMIQNYNLLNLLTNQFTKDLKSPIMVQNQLLKLVAVKKYLLYSYQMIIISIFNGVFRTELIHTVILMKIILKSSETTLLLQKTATYGLKWHVIMISWEQFLRLKHFVLMVVKEK